MASVLRCPPVCYQSITPSPENSGKLVGALMCEKTGVIQWCPFHTNPTSCGLTLQSWFGKGNPWWHTHTCTTCTLGTGTLSNTRGSGSVGSEGTLQYRDLWSDSMEWPPSACARVSCDLGRFRHCVPFHTATQQDSLLST